MDLVSLDVINCCCFFQTAPDSFNVKGFMLCYYKRMPLGVVIIQILTEMNKTETETEIKTKTNCSFQLVVIDS